MSVKMLNTVLDLVQVTTEQRNEIKDLKCELDTAHAKNDELLQLQDANSSLLDRAMLTLDDYLNAGDKESRGKARENAKFIYKEYMGRDYVNRNER